MTAAAFDTLKLAERLHGSGFSKKQSVGLAEGLAEALAESHPTKDAVVEVVETVGRSVDRRLNSLEAGQARLESKVGALEAGQARLEAKTDKLEAGQSVLMDNQAELRRDVQNGNQMLTAIMAHLGIPKP